MKDWIIIAGLVSLIIALLMLAVAAHAAVEIEKCQKRNRHEQK